MPLPSHSKIEASIEASRNFLRPLIPDSVIHMLTIHSDAGHESWLVGEGMLELARGERPTRFEVVTTASSKALFDLHPRAVSIRPEAGLVCLPTSAGPIDIHCGTGARSIGSVEAFLASRPFSVLALAFDPLHDRWLDPSGGLADLDEGLLRHVAAGEGVDPLLGLDVARLISERGLHPDPDLIERVRRLEPASPKARRTRIRRALRRILLGRYCERGLEFLRSTGSDAAFADGVRADAARAVAAMPARLPIRLVAWLRDTDARQALRRIGLGVEASQQIYRLLEHHPIDRAVSSTRAAQLGRLQRRLSPLELDWLSQLRDWEIRELGESQAAISARRAFEVMEEALEEGRRREAAAKTRPRLALGGRDVMRILALDAGPEVGLALRDLEAFVARQPDRNTTAALEQRLQIWNRERCKNS